MPRHTPAAAPQHARPEPQDQGCHAFDWNDDDDCVVVHGQAPIAVYLNDIGNVVLRRQREPNFEEDDVFTVIEPHHVPHVAAAMRAFARSV